MSRENAARRNRALRKIRQCRKLPLEVKATIEAILDCLNPKTDYRIAWPSAANLAKRLNRSVRTIRWHLKAIKRTGIFEFLHLSPSQATEYIEKNFGYKPRFDRCSVQAPTIFLPNESHWLWDKSTKVPAERDQQLADVVQEVLSARNRHRDKKPVNAKSEHIGQQASVVLPENRSAYDLNAIRANLQRFLDSAEARQATALAERAGDVVNDTVRNVVGDTAHDVVSDTQEREKKKDRRDARSSLSSLGPHPTLPVLEDPQLEVDDASLAVAKATARVELRSRNEADKSSSFLPLRSNPSRFWKKQGVTEDGCEEEGDDLSDEEWFTLEQELLSLEEEDDD
ncbi:HTH domain-containing protein [Candidatus Woesearchaeota archaeon]|nr:HTH domain-containing protein [Candidatus Woesearchaeota archaeon]